MSLSVIMGQPALGNTFGRAILHPITPEPQVTRATSARCVTQPWVATSAHVTRQPIGSFLGPLAAVPGRCSLRHHNNGELQGLALKPTRDTSTLIQIITSQPGSISVRSHSIRSSHGSRPSSLSHASLLPLAGTRNGHASTTRELRKDVQGRQSVVAKAAVQDAREAFAVSDAELESQGLRMRSDYQGIDLDQLNNLFGKVGFPRRVKPRLLLALQNTPHLLWLEDIKASQVVGFARATGDGVFNAIIWDVVIDPSLQGQGLGKALMERMLQVLLAQGICNIGLFAESGVVTFYKPLGFMPDPDGVRCMALRRKTV